MEIPKHGISNPNSVISSETIRQKGLKKKKKKTELCQEERKKVISTKSNKQPS